MPQKHQPGCTCSGCCTDWFCKTLSGGKPPKQIFATVSTYGSFTLPRVAKAPTGFESGAPDDSCYYYYLATTINFPGVGNCPAVSDLPVCIFVDPTPLNVIFQMVWPTGDDEACQAPTLDPCSPQCMPGFQQGPYAGQTGVPCPCAYALPNPCRFNNGIGSYGGTFGVIVGCPRARPFTFSATALLCPNGNACRLTGNCACLNAGGCYGFVNRAYTLFGGSCGDGEIPPTIAVTVDLSE